MRKRVAVLAGDGIGPEVMTETLRVLNHLGGDAVMYSPGLIGGAAFDVHRQHFPDETLALCRDSAAILFGSVGGPVESSPGEKWMNCEANSILAIRKAFQFCANYRPLRVFPALQSISPLKESLLASGIDVLIIRELLGDIYFGEHATTTRNGKRFASDVAEYSEDQIAAVARPAFEAARKRRGKVTSVDKANVLDTSKLWRAIVSEIGHDYPDVALEHMLVDNCAMQIIRAPAHFDVIVTSNMFGDILSDAAAVIPGSLGLTPSASLNADGFGLYEPSGGSAPDIAGTDTANPIAQLLSAALMFRHSLFMEEEASRLETAIEATLHDGFRTRDITQPGTSLVGTRAFASEVIARLK